MTEISDTLSKTIAMIRFPMIVGIVFIHSQNKGLFTGAWGGQISDIPCYMFIQNIVSLCICRVSVPLFFLISGYLFFVNTSWNKQAYMSKLRRRVKTLLVPYILYTIIALTIFGVIQQLVPSMISDGKTPIADYGIKEYLQAFWMYNGESIPFVGPFWFLRNLMILCIFSPFVYNLGRYLKVYGLIVIFVLHLLKVHTYMSDLFYFSTGAWFAINNTDFGRLFSKWRVIWVLYPLILVTDALTKDCSFNYVLHQICVMLGLISFVGISWLAVEKRGNFMPTVLSSATFFIYAAHEPYFDQVRKVVFRVLSMPQNSMVADAEMITLYFVIPVLFISFLIVFYYCIAKVSPTIACVLSGNR